MSHSTHSQPDAGRTPAPSPDDCEPLCVLPLDGEAWRPFLAALGCPDRPPEVSEHGKLLFWDEGPDDLPACLPDILPEMPCTIRADGRDRVGHAHLRGYRVDDVMLLALLVPEPFPHLWVRLCAGPYEAGQRAADLVSLWVRMGLGFTCSIPLPAPSDMETELFVGAQLLEREPAAS